MCRLPPVLGQRRGSLSLLLLGQGLPQPQQMLCRSCSHFKGSLEQRAGLSTWSQSPPSIPADFSPRLPDF